MMPKAETHPRAGKLPTEHELIDPEKIRKMYEEAPASEVSPVEFGTSGHRGTPLAGTFCRPHVEAIVQAICDYRKMKGYDGPVFVGFDTHAVSKHAFATTLEVLAGNGVSCIIEEGYLPTPTPAISRAILFYNVEQCRGVADGIIITPSHNPPEDGGIKYNPPHGGPAETSVTEWIQRRANELLKGRNRDVRRATVTQAGSELIHPVRLRRHYAEAIAQVIDINLVRSSGVRLGVDPLGGASLYYWQEIAELYGLKIDLLNPNIDPRFGFLHLDHDGRIRMDCSSPYVMSGLIEQRWRFDVACGCDPDADRHGIVTRSGGLLNPNLYLAVAILYLHQTRNCWPRTLQIGKTVVTSSIVDRLVNAVGRQLYEVPVGFKWFASGLYERWLAFGGEESAGATFLKMDGSVWTTDKDGILLSLLAGEITARSGRDPGQWAEQVQAEHGRIYYRRVDLPISADFRERLKRLEPRRLVIKELAGEPVEQVLTHAPGNKQPIGGVKIVARSGWFALRPSGTELIAKLYAESFKGEEHLEAILTEASDFLQHLL